MNQPYPTIVNCPVPPPMPGKASPTNAEPNSKANTPPFYENSVKPRASSVKSLLKANVIFFDNRLAAKEPWTKAVWFYDFRTKIHFTLKKNPLKLSDLQDFIHCYNPSNLHQREETYHSETNSEARWRKFSYEEIINRDIAVFSRMRGNRILERLTAQDCNTPHSCDYRYKTSLDITWIKDQSLTDLDNLPDPDILANDIIENLEASIEDFKEIMEAIASNQ